MPPGPSPKDMGQKAGNGGRNAPWAVVPTRRADAPELPAFFRYWDGESTRRIKYPPETVRWWNNWASEESPLNKNFTAHDWDYLLETSVMHAKFWLGIDQAKMASELRQRVAKYGATPEDRAKLRIVLVSADEAAERAAEAAEYNTKRGYSADAVRRLTSIPGFKNEETA